MLKCYLVTFGLSTTKKGKNELVTSIALCFNGLQGNERGEASLGHRVRKAVEAFINKSKLFYKNCRFERVFH